MQTLAEIITNTWSMIAEMGSFLLLGFAISAVLHQYLRKAWIERLMGRQGISSIVWGSVVGVPMPLCSCGVIPVTMSLRDKGASKGATVSFLTSTPQTGVDSFLATWAMLGPVFTIYKVIVAFISGITVGLFVDRFEHSRKSLAAPAASETKDEKPSKAASLKYAFYTMPGDLANALIIGFILAGLIASLAPDNLLGNLPGGVFTAIVLSSVISVPLYICATGSIPLALALIYSGLPVSAALVLLIAGPATNVATINVMRRVLGNRTTIIYVAGVVLSAWLAAGLYQVLFAESSFTQHAMQHEMSLPLWKHLGGAALIAMLLWPKVLPLLRRKPTAFESTGSTQTTAMKTARISIDGMNCSHCENSVRNGLTGLAFAPEVLSVDAKTKEAVIQADSIDQDAIEQKVNALGFEYKGCEVT